MRKKTRIKLNYYLITAGPLAGLISGVLVFKLTADISIAKTTAVILWMAFWWITEALNIYYTALIPVFMLPLLGIMGMEEVAREYMNQVIFLFIGGFLLAYAFEKSNLHKRIALKIILTIGSTFPGVVFGLMTAAFILSMWMSNTATTMLLIPSVIAIISQLESNNPNADISTPLLLGLTYAATIGGMATIVGSPPNMILLNIYNKTFPDMGPITFTNWMMVGLPFSLVFLIISFYILKWHYFSKGKRLLKINLDDCRGEYTSLGKFSRDEKIVQVVFYLTVVLWFFLKDLEIGGLHVQGWTSFFDYGDKITEGTVAILMAAILFLIPSEDKEGETLLSWKEVQKIPIGIIFLFGGGFSIAQAMEVSGLSGLLAEKLIILGSLKPVFIILVLSAIVILLSEIATNTAAILLLLPIVIAMGTAMEIHPLYLMFPATLAASCGFMLPVATPPNTIVFATEKLRVKDMVRTGILMNFIAMALITLVAITIGKSVFGF